MNKKELTKKILFITLGILLITLIAFIVIKYQVEGEKVLPYKIEKILIMSHVDGEKVDETEYLWDINISQANDIYIYLNKEDKEKIAISKIKLDNFKVNLPPQKGEISILRPTGELENLYQYSVDDYKNSEIEYIGGMIDDLKMLQTNNSGGIVAFRTEIKNLGQYQSNDDLEIVYDGSLLNKIEVGLDDIKTNISFDLSIETSENITYKTTATLDLPVGDIITEGTSSIEITDLENLVFKRV